MNVLYLMGNCDYLVGYFYCLSHGKYSFTVVHGCVCHMFIVSSLVEFIARMNRRFIEQNLFVFYEF